MNVVVMDYDPRWARDFDALYARIWPAVQDFAVCVEHVGSTSVPGLAAKPVLDIDIVLPSQESLPLAIERLAAIDYAYRGNLGIDGREAFRHRVNQPAHNLYACARGSDALRDHLTFRDYLRAHLEAAGAYADLKRALARRYPHDVDSYAQAKTNFVLGVLQKAGIPAARLNHIRRENGL